MFSHFVQLQYCYDYLINQIPVELLIYSHIPTALVALIFSGYVVYKARKLSSIALFIVCFAFAMWCFFDLSSWFAFLGSEITMFTWSLVDLFALIFFFFSYYFLYTFIKNRDLPLWQTIIGIALLAPTFIWTFLGLNLEAFDANVCEAWENESIALYPYFVEVVFLLATVVLGAESYIREKNKKHKREILLSTIGVLIFLFFFFTATLSVNFLVNYAALEYAYNFEIYGLFGMPILLIYLGYLIVRYQAFNVKVFGTQALVVALIVLIASEFAFVTTLANRVLVGVTLVFTSFIGIILVRSVRREIDQREHIEILAGKLETANKQQVVLLRFITHQVKGFLTKSRNAFSMLVDGDYGPISDQVKKIVEAGFDSDTKGVTMVQEILNAANIRNGTVQYAMAAFDFSALIEEVVEDLRGGAEAKGLTLTFHPCPDTCQIEGDRPQLQNAIKNLIDNSIKYTLKGQVDVSLDPKGEMVRLTVKDTGVGITSEDMQHLFTEGGHGKDSQKVNVESTGYGLYIVKSIIEAHKGKVWAESEGAGKGSSFIVELPHHAVQS